MKNCDEDLRRVEPSPVKIGRNIDGEYGGVAESQARCLIDRVDTVGPGAAAAVANGHYERRRLCPRREMLTSCASHRVTMP